MRNNTSKEKKCIKVFSYIFPPAIFSGKNRMVTMYESLLNLELYCIDEDQKDVTAGYGGVRHCHNGTRFG